MDVAAKARTRVEYLADRDPRWQVRVAAWVALQNADVDAAVVAFMATGGGYDQAKADAAETIAMNIEIIDWVLATTTIDSSPAVFLAATMAKAGTFDDQDAFARTGWDEAKAIDAAAGAAHAEQVAQQAEQDRAFVAELAAHAPGAWVRIAAGRAIKVGTDAALAQFFKYEWFGSAGCDVQADQVRLADADVRAQAAVAQLTEWARQAEQAYQGAAGAAADRARVEAAAAWQAVADQAQVVGPDWAGEQQQATAQIQAWATVATAAATATTGQDWAGIHVQAMGMQASWQQMRDWAQSQAQEWAAVVSTARGNQARLLAGATPPAA